MNQTTKTAGITVFALVMLISGSIDSIRNLPTTALFGNTLIFFFIFASLVFLIPAALVSAELSSSWTEEGGIYGWVNSAFGEHFAFLAIWLQWINTMVWYPTMLSFIAGTAAFLIDPNLATHKVYLVMVILSVFWFLTLLNLRGLKASTRFASICAVIGMIIPMILIIVLGIIWVIKGSPVQLHLTPKTMLPSFGHSESWISLTAIMTAFLGMELATVHVKNINNPQKKFPKAMLYSVIIILATMILGSLAIAIVLPHNQINLVDGIMQAFTSYFHAYHIAWIIPIITVMILIGSLGSMVNWIISPAKGLLLAAQHGYLPKFLCKENQQGVASNLLLLQAVLVSFMCLAFLLMPSVNGSYWLLTDLSTQLYMMMYVLMFLAALVLRYKYAYKPRPFKIPGGNFGMWCVSLLGLLGCLITLVVGFFPPDSINVGGKLHYEAIFTGGIIVMILPIVIFYLYAASKKTST